MALGHELLDAFRLRLTHVHVSSVTPACPSAWRRDRRARGPVRRRAGALRRRALDSRSRVNLAAGEALGQLARQTGAQFPNLTAARARTEAELVHRRASVSAIRLPEGSSLCLMGSWGRREVVDGSDDDWLLLVEDETVASRGRRRSRRRSRSSRGSRACSGRPPAPAT